MKLYKVLRGEPKCLKALLLWNAKSVTQKKVVLKELALYRIQTSKTQYFKWHNKMEEWS